MDPSSLVKIAALNYFGTHKMPEHEARALIGSLFPTVKDNFSGRLEQRRRENMMRFWGSCRQLLLLTLLPLRLIHTHKC